VTGFNGKLRGLLWWVDRWQTSTAYKDLSLEQQGAYRNLLDEAWIRGGAIPDDDATLAKACGDPSRWTAVKSIVMRRFYRAPDGWRNETLDRVLRESQARAEAQARYRAKQHQR
jgi:uncharacterized protein YdaU (DUF1376 family)